MISKFFLKPYRNLAQLGGAFGTGRLRRLLRFAQQSLASLPGLSSLCLALLCTRLNSADGKFERHWSVTCKSVAGCKKIQCKTAGQTGFQAG